MKAIIATMLCFFVSATQAELTAFCSSVNGQGVYAGMDFGEYLKLHDKAPIRAPEFHKDGISGSNLLYLMDARDTTTLKVAWNSEKNDPEFLNIPIVLNHPDQITALERSGGGVWLHTIYPNIGYAFITRHTHSNYPAASGSLFAAKCQFKGEW